MQRMKVTVGTATSRHRFKFSLEHKASLTNLIALMIARRAPQIATSRPWTYPNFLLLAALRMQRNICLFVFEQHPDLDISNFSQCNLCHCTIFSLKNFFIKISNSTSELTNRIILKLVPGAVVCTYYSSGQSRLANTELPRVILRING